MASILIKDTTREQREQIVRESLGDDYDVGCGYESTGINYQLYIDGIKELRELNMLLLQTARFALSQQAVPAWILKYNLFLNKSEALFCEFAQFFKVCHGCKQDCNPVFFVHVICREN